MLRLLYLCDLCWRGWATSAILLIILDYLNISFNVVQDIITNSGDFGLKNNNFFFNKLCQLKNLVVFNFKDFILPNGCLLVHIFIKLFIKLLKHPRECSAAAIIPNNIAVTFQYFKLASHMP